ncbi:hypothetical protein [Prescottella equi]
MSTNHIAVVNARGKRPARRCRHRDCVQLTRHRGQMCPDHRTRH